MKTLHKYLKKNPQLKVSVEPHPDEVIDVDPEIIANMKRRLKAPKGPKHKRDLISGDE